MNAWVWWFCLASSGIAHGGEGLLTVAPVELELPRAEREETERSIAVDGPWRLVGSSRGIRSYEAPLPVRPRALFFERAPADMTVRRSGVPSLRNTAVTDPVRADTWSFSQDGLIVRVGPEGKPPSSGEVTVTHPTASSREDALWRATADVSSDLDFVQQSFQIDDVVRRGAYLPAPARAAWDVAVPVDGIFRFDAVIVPPEVEDGTSSDGAEVEVSVGDERVYVARVAVGAPTSHRVSLARWAGARVRLQVRTRDGDTTRDHVLVADPAVYAPVSNPRRLVFVFVDTLRQDHLGVSGYRRDTSPNIDAWAGDAVVFDQARSVAPWTLPSTRSVLTGRQPEFWKDAPTVAERLAELGWATAAYTGNVYLSSNFDMARGWTEHGCVNWPGADFETWRAIDFLERHPDRDAFVMVHYMDMHLPYKEPPAYRRLYAGSPPDALGELFTRAMVLQAAKSAPDAVRDYLIDRYDQNLRYIDDQFARLRAAAGDDATIVFFADHGEEFWDHGEFEHGHALYDELLHVPLIVSSPGLAPRRVDTNVSLLDVAPTVLELLGLSDPDAHGRSLVAVARGEDPGDLRDRPIGFGRLLYGDDGWGMVRNRTKYVTRSGEERLWNLAKDPGETTNLRPREDPGPARTDLATALRRDVRLAWRFAVASRRNSDVRFTLESPAGFEAAWVSDDPTNKSAAAVSETSATERKIRIERSQGQTREVFVVPAGDPLAATTGTVLRNPQGEVSLDASPAWDGTPERLATLGRGSSKIVVTWALQPLPAGEDTRGTDTEQASTLKAIGYTGDDEAPGEPTD